MTPGYGDPVRLDARINRELVSQLLDAKMTAEAICKRTRLSLRTVQEIARYLHRKLPRKVRRGASAPLADVPALRRLVKAKGVSAAAREMGVSRQAIYLRLRSPAPARS